MTDNPQLTLYSYRATIRFVRPVTVPAHNRSVLWRGAFGDTFRPLVCHDLDLACSACSLRSACPFPRVFAPSIPEGRPDIARLRDPPRPFVLVDPHPQAPSLAADTPLSLGLVLVERAVVELPYFFVALRRLGADGMGRARARFSIEALRCVDATGLDGPLVWERGSEQLRPSRVPLRAADLARPGDAGATRVRVTFVTPTDVRGGGAGLAGAPSFGALIRRIRDRVGALATFFGDGPLSHDPRALADSADSVESIRAEVMPAGTIRRSSRTGQRHAVGGVVGEAIYQGRAVGSIMPWLRLAEVLGVGKHATFGNGRIAADVLG